MPLKKATLLFDENVYEKLRAKSLIDDVSIGELVREAVSVYYGIRDTEEKLRSLNKLSSMKLPVGSPELIEQQILGYNNNVEPYYTKWVYDVEADLTAGGLATDLTISFQVDFSGNTAEPIYIALEDSTGAVAVVPYPDPEDIQKTDWVVWRIPLSEFAGVDLTAVVKAYIQIGDKEAGGDTTGSLILCNFKSDPGPETVALYVTVRDATEAPVEGATVTIKGKPIAGRSEHNCGDWVTDRDGECGPACPYINNTYEITVKIDGNVMYCKQHTIDDDTCEQLIFGICELVIDLLPTESYDQPTEEFLGDGDSFDLAYSSVTFTPTSGGTNYIVSLEDITQLPTNPAAGTDIPLGDDDYYEVGFSDPVSIRIFNKSFSTFFVGSNGYVTFTQGDWDASQTLEEHFEILRISGLYCNLAPNVAGSVKAQYCMNRVAVTWQGVQEYSNTATNTFQIEMFFDGRIRLSWLEINANECIVGLSNGEGLPDGFVETAFSDLIVRYAKP